MLSTVIPLAIYCGRNNIRVQRRKIVQDLQVMFDFAKVVDGRPIIIPSFELVKYKYDPDPAESGQEQGHDQSSGWNYAIPVILYILLATLGFHLCFSDQKITSINPYLRGGEADLTNLQMAGFTANSCYTFLGAYLFTIFYLIKRVSNFDLSPLSFLRTSAHIIFAMFVSAAVWQCTIHTFPSRLDAYAPSAALAFPYRVVS